ncbi:MAG: hypothetical protein ACYDC1_00175 [Limisphaerales bacterium]
MTLTTGTFSCRRISSNSVVVLHRPYPISRLAPPGPKARATQK